jgi:NTE family protein
MAAPAIRACPLGETVHRSAEPPRPAARAIRSLKDMQAYGDGVHRPYLHLVDGGVSDNVGMRAVLDSLEISQALHEVGRTDAARPRAPDHRLHRQLALFAADQLGRIRDSARHGQNILLKSAGVPIDRYSYEAVELLRDMAARWQTLRLIGKSAAMAANKDPVVAAALRVPNAEIYAIDVSFAALKDKDELAYLNQQPTSFVLPDEAVDRLRAAAGTIIMDSPEFQRLLKDVGAKIVTDDRLRAGATTTGAAAK